MKNKMSFADWKNQKWESIKIEIKSPQQCETLAEYFMEYGRFYNVSLDAIKEHYEKIRRG